ncbi:MAG: hypothetical protein E6J90_10530 [Deltaproteobacteria bacterium]|nr:MAG: hypothetical protein E6J91_30040 [Deltaproteobacteria bacterium]TMQ23480.1 MAG: hypothetical protein E6J90_10530 [Deltaproteobacteria bacterium]
MAYMTICVMLACAAGCHAGGSSPPASPAAPSAAAPAAPAALGDPAGPPVIGVWRGTSQCTVRPSPCNDEIVVYHVSAGAGPDELAVQANKVVDGREEDMGTLHCRLQRAERRLRCPIEKGVFVYAIDGDRMHGTLDLTDGTRYRVIEVERAR